MHVNQPHICIYVCMYVCMCYTSVVEFVFVGSSKYRKHDCEEKELGWVGYDRSWHVGMYIYIYEWLSWQKRYTPTDRES